jgi:hypothetical protein
MLHLRMDDWHLDEEMVRLKCECPHWCHEACLAPAVFQTSGCPYMQNTYYIRWTTRQALQPRQEKEMRLGLANYCSGGRLPLILLSNLIPGGQVHRSGGVWQKSLKPIN